MSGHPDNAAPPSARRDGNESSRGTAEAHTTNNHSNNTTTYNTTNNNSNNTINISNVIIHLHVDGNSGEWRRAGAGGRGHSNDGRHGRTSPVVLDLAVLAAQSVRASVEISEESSGGGQGSPNILTLWGR